MTAEVTRVVKFRLGYALNARPRADCAQDIHIHMITDISYDTLM